MPELHLPTPERNLTQADHSDDVSQTELSIQSRSSEWFEQRRQVVTASNANYTFGSFEQSIRSAQTRAMRVMPGTMYGQIGAWLNTLIIIAPDSVGQQLNSMTLAEFHRAGQVPSQPGRIHSHQNNRRGRIGRDHTEFYNNNSSLYPASMFAGPIYCDVKSNIYTGKIPLKLLKKYQRKTCSICCDEIKINKRTVISVTNCNHVFHSNCINKWIESYNFNGCPDCRDKLQTKCHLYDEIEITDDPFPSERIKVKYPRMSLKKLMSKYTFKRYPAKCY